MLSFEGRPVREEEPISSQEPVIDHPLTWTSLVGEPSVLQLLAERVQQEPLFKQQLLGMGERSKTDKGVHTAAANAITILVRARLR